MPQIPARAAAAVVACLLIAACNERQAAGDPAGLEPSSETLAEVLEGQGELDTLGQVAANAGLTGVLEGVGPYTVFAPADPAFGAAVDFTAEDMQPQAAALLRAHIVPGAVTRQDLIAAIEAAGGDGAQLRTMADTLLTFRRDGEAITVSADNGAEARLTGEEQLASNGVLQPVDGLLAAAEVEADAAAAPAPAEG